MRLVKAVAVVTAVAAAVVACGLLAGASLSECVSPDNHPGRAAVARWVKGLAPR